MFLFRLWASLVLYIIFLCFDSVLAEHYTADESAHMLIIFYHPSGGIIF